MPQTLAQLIGKGGFPPAVAGRRVIAGLVVALCAAGLTGALVFPAHALPLLAITAAAVLLALMGLRRAEALPLLRAADRAAARLIQHDPATAFVTDDAGRIVAANPAARRGDGPDLAQIAARLADQVLDAGAIFLRLQDRARRDGAARDTVPAACGPVTLLVHRLGPGRFLWRIGGLEDPGAAAGTPVRAADSLTLPMLTANAQGTVLFANAALRQMLGFRPRRLQDVLGPPDDLRQGQIRRIDTPDGPRALRLSLHAAQSGRREIYLCPVNDPGGTGDAADGTGPGLPPQDMPPVVDFEDLPVPLMRFDADGRLIRANRAARDLAGLTAQDRPRVQDLLDGLGRPVRDWLADVARQRHPGGAEVLQIIPAAAESFVQVTLRRIAPEGQCSGAPGEVLAILQDATTLKRIEAQYVQSQKMQAIGQLAGGVAHDFNNLLTAISGHCDLMLLRKRAGDPDHADLTQISQNANRAAALVSQLLAFSRKQTMTPERIDLPETLGDLGHLLSRLVGEKIELRLTHDPALGPVRADRRQIEQTIMNLVVNARDAMPDGGLIRIDTQDARLTEDMPRDRAVVPAGRYAVIRVRDEGTGIAPDKLDKIFEPFFTTKRPGEGTGLGLSMVYGIVKQSGGFVFVSSVMGEGSTFDVWLPVHDGPVPAAADPVAPPLRAAPRKTEGTILLVEDEPPVRAFAARALRLRGHNVLEADTAEEALRILDDPALQVDVFVTDVVMPGLDGPTWVAEALKTRADVRVVFMSGYAEDCLADMPETLPGSIFLPKPFSLADLTRTVQRQLEAEQGAARDQAGGASLS